MSRAESMRLVKKLEKQGFVVRRTGSGHWNVTRPGVEGVVTMAFSPRGGGLHKTIKRLQKLGYKP